MDFMTRRSLVLVSFLALTASSASAEILPGFRIEKLADTAGFLSSLAFNPSGHLFYSATSGEVYRLDGTASTQVALVPSANDGNAALLGIAFQSDHEFVTHYVPPDLTADVVSSVNLATGIQTEIARYVCDNGRPCPSEHHGGNLIVAPDGSIFVGIGDYGGGIVAQNPNSPGGKIFRISPEGESSMFALGFRNPFDFALHPESGELIVGDNGPVGGDEVHIISEEANAGWPFTVGNDPPVEGTVRPDYTWSETVAPTGVIFIGGPSPMPDGGLLVGAFVTSALYYFPDLSGRPLGDPIILVEDETPPIIDIAQNVEGEIFFATPFAIYRLHLPLPGDANGDGRVDGTDGRALAHEIVDGDGALAIRTQDGAVNGSWGSDVNRDGLVDARDLVSLAKMRKGRTRGAHPPPGL